MRATTGTLRPKNANAVMAKNATATITQSPRIIPFYQLFRKGPANNKGTEPNPSWLTRK